MLRFAEEIAVQTETSENLTEFLIVIKEVFQTDYNRMSNKGKTKDNLLMNVGYGQLQEDEEFSYLGGWITRDDEVRDIVSRIVQAKAVFLQKALLES